MESGRVYANLDVVFLELLSEHRLRCLISEAVMLMRWIEAGLLVQKLVHLPVVTTAEVGWQAQLLPPL
jgi:hypothetical protein